MSPIPHYERMWISQSLVALGLLLGIAVCTAFDYQAEISDETHDIGLKGDHCGKEWRGGVWWTLWEQTDREQRIRRTTVIVSKVFCDRRMKFYRQSRIALLASDWIQNYLKSEAPIQINICDNRIRVTRTRFITNQEFHHIVITGAKYSATLDVGLAAGWFDHQMESFSWVSEHQALRLDHREFYHQSKYHGVCALETENLSWDEYQCLELLVILFHSFITVYHACSANLQVSLLYIS